MQADAILLERNAFMFGRRRANPNGRASADAVIDLAAVDHRLQPEKRQQLPVEFARAVEIRCGQNNMGNAVDFHRLPLATGARCRLARDDAIVSIQEFDQRRAGP